MSQPTAEEWIILAQASELVGRHIIDIGTARWVLTAATNATNRLPEKSKDVPNDYQESPVSPQQPAQLAEPTDLPTDSATQSEVEHKSVNRGGQSRPVARPVARPEATLLHQAMAPYKESALSPITRQSRTEPVGIEPWNKGLKNHGDRPLRQPIPRKVAYSGLNDDILTGPDSNADDESDLEMKSAEEDKVKNNTSTQDLTTGTGSGTPTFERPGSPVQKPKSNLIKREPGENGRDRAKRTLEYAQHNPDDQDAQRRATCVAKKLEAKAEKSKAKSKAKRLKRRKENKALREAA